MTERAINIQDSDLESLAGSVQRKKMEETPGGPTPEGPVTPGGFFGNLGNLLGLKHETPGKGDDLLKWKEFPWEKYIVQEDIIAKWKKIDMAEVNNLLRNFNAETKEF